MQYASGKDWITIKISGVDLMNYLNGIITLDLEKIEEDKYYRAAFLTPKAKIRSVFWLKIMADVLYIIAPPVTKDNLIQDLLKYKLSMNVVLEDITAEVNPLYLIESSMKIPGLADLEPQYLDIEPEGKPINDLDDYLISHNEAPFSILLDENPYEVGMNDAISLEKGCFLGQEPIARMFYRGRPRKSLFHLHHQPTTATSLIVDHELIGQIIVSNSEGNESVASVNTGTDTSRLQLEDGTTIEQLGLIGTYPVITR